MLATYTEEQLIHRKLPDVYGQDGSGWYTYADGLADLQAALAADGRPKAKTKPSKNPLFVYLPNMSRRDFIALGYVGE